MDKGGTLWDGGTGYHTTVPVRKKNERLRKKRGGGTEKVTDGDERGKKKGRRCARVTHHGAPVRKNCQDFKKKRARWFADVKGLGLWQRVRGQRGGALAGLGPKQLWQKGAGS